MTAERRPAPRGERRLLYVSDPSLIASRYLPDPVTETHLRDWIDDVAAAGPDLFIQEVYTQGWTTYWRSPGFDYDARLQHRRFLPLLEEGTQPFAILLSQCRARGMEVMGGFRMNDNHTDSVRQGVGAGAGFIVDNPQFRLRDAPPGPTYRLSEPLDFSFPEVRAYLLSVITRFVELFAVDGVELCFRDNRYFPPDTGPEREHLMTDLVRQVRALLDRSRAGKRLLIGCRVPSTIDECHVMGLDLPTWVGDGLVDHVAPQDTMYAEANIPYAEWRELTEGGACRLYPALMNWASHRARKRAGQQPITQDQRRALVTSMYAQGADGISLYNHFLVMTWSGGDPGDWTSRGAGAHAPFYPFALHDMEDLRTPELALRGRRHYVFDPTWGGMRGFGPDRASSGKIKAQRAVLRRPDGAAAYRFRLYEDLDDVAAAMLLFRAHHLSLADTLAVSLNGRAVPDRGLRRRDDEVRIDLRPREVPPGPDAAASHADTRPFVTYWFPLTADLTVRGENSLDLRLLRSNPAAQEAVVVEEVEVYVVPRAIT